MNTTFPNFLKDAKQFRTIPIISHYFADTVTPIQMFQQLECEAVFLLESKDDQSSWSRFSFIGLKEKYSITEVNNQYFFRRANKEVILSRSSFKAAFESAINYMHVKVDEQLEIPFVGGAVGAISYDAVDVIEPVLQSHESNSSKSMHFIFCETILAYDHIKKELYHIHYVTLNGFESEFDLKEIFHESQKQKEQLLEKIFTSSAQTKWITPRLDEDVSFQGVKSNYSKERFIEHVEKIKEYILAGDIFQAVLSQRFELNITIKGIDIFRVLRMINPSPYLFYLKIDGVEIIGSSPEKLVQVQNGQVEIHPIAGTRKRGSTPMEDKQLAQELLHDEKEKAEHFMLVDLARNDIGKVSSFGSVKVSELMEIGKFSHVMHMISKVTGTLSHDVHPIEAMLASFPAGTVSGAPKIRAMQIIKELEPTKRGYYAGAISYLSYDGNIDSCIAIRTMIIKDRKAYVQAGAGIVSDSIPENEWEETRNKAKALIKAIRVAQTMFHTETEGNVHA